MRYSLRFLGGKVNQAIWLTNSFKLMGIGAAILAAFVALAGAAWSNHIPDLACFFLFLGSYWAFFYMFIFFDYRSSMSNRMKECLKNKFHLTKEDRLFLIKINYIIALFVIFLFAYQGIYHKIEKDDLANPLQVIAQLCCFLYNSKIIKNERGKHLIMLSFFLSLSSTLFHQGIDLEILFVLMVIFQLIILLVPFDYVFLSIFGGYFLDQGMAKWGFYMAFQQGVYCLLSFFLAKEESSAHLKKRILSFFCLVVLQILVGFFYFNDFYLNEPMQLALLSSGACIVFINIKRRSEWAFGIAFSCYFLISVAVGIISPHQDKSIVWGIPDGLFIFLLVHLCIFFWYLCFKESIPRNMQPLLPFFFCGLFLVIGSFTKLAWLEKWLEGIDLLLLILGLYSIIEEESSQHGIPVDVVDQFRILNLDMELELFARIRLLENRMIEGLPPQLNLGEYETLIRGFLDDTLTIDHYCTTMSNELFDITVMELKADLLEQLFNLLVSETPARLTQILAESPFPERAIRSEALEFINDFLERLGMTDPRSPFDKSLLDSTLRYWLQDVIINLHRSAFYMNFLEHFRGSI